MDIFHVIFDFQKRHIVRNAKLNPKKNYNLNVRPDQTTEPELVQGVASQNQAINQMSEVCSFLDQVSDELAEVTDLFAPNPRLKMVLTLLARHFEAKSTTATFLIASSGTPYATATRRLKDLIDAGLVDKRVRGQGGKSFTLHPSEDLLTKFQKVSQHVSQLVTDYFEPRTAAGEGTAFYFGESYRKAKAIPPLNVLDQTLDLAGGLRLIVHGDPTFMVLADLKKHFEQAFGCTLHLKALSLDELHQEVLQNAARKRSLFDIVAVNLPRLGEFAEKDVLMPLDEVLDIESLDPADFYPEGWKATHWDGRCYGVPAQTTSELLFYRTDLFKEAGLTPPTTTDELLAAARALHQPEKKRFGIAWSGARGTALGHTFLMAMADFGQPVVSLPEVPGGYDSLNFGKSSYLPMINSDAGRKAAEFLLELLQYSPPSVLSMSWYERISRYADGSCAMAYGFTQMTPYFESNPSSVAHGNTGYLPHPSGCGARGISPVGGYILGIPSNLSPERIESAGRALAHLTSPQAQKLFIQNGSRGTPRYSVAEDAEVHDVSPIFDVIDDLSRNDLLQTWPRPPIPEIEAIVQACGSSIHDLLRGQISIEEALERAQEAASQAIMGSKH